MCVCESVFIWYTYMCVYVYVGVYVCSVRLRREQKYDTKDVSVRVRMCAFMCVPVRMCELASIGEREAWEYGMVSRIGFR